MADIFNINNWAASTLYNIDDIVINGSYYYYSKTRHTSTSNFTTDKNNGSWGGVITYNGETKPYFEWKPSYNYRVPIKPLVNTIKFSEGYAQDINDSISSNLLTLELQFNDRSLSEISAILHFLNTRKNERFFFIPPQPYGIVKRFICLEFEHTQSFYDKYSLSCRFDERI